MATIRKILISSSLILISLFLITATIYITLIYKPDSLIFIANKYLYDDYTIEYQNAGSDKNLLSPVFNFEGVIVKDLNNKIILEADRIGLGINFTKIYSKNHIHLNFLDLQNFSFINKPESNHKANFKLMIGRTIIESKAFNLRANNTLIESKNGSISIINSNGKLNNIIFEELNIFNKFGSNKIFYSSAFNLDEKTIVNENLINLKAFLDYEIDLRVYSKGYFATDSKNLVNINKYIFKESKLITNLEYPIKNIDLVLHSNLNQRLAGIFVASIPDQDIKGSILINDQLVKIRSKFKFDMNEVVNYKDYLQLEGLEEFSGVLTINNDLVSINLETDLSNTRITSIINSLNKEISKNLKTTINIKDLSQPTYFIENADFRSYIDQNNKGYFSLGNDYDEEIKNIDYQEGFFIYLSLDRLNINELSFNDQVNNSSNLISIQLKVKELNLLENIYEDQEFKIDFKKNNIDALFSGKDLNGLIKVDETGFARVEVFDTKFQFKEQDFFKSDGPSKSNELFKLKNINLRFIGNNIQISEDIFQDINFYILGNEKITTFDDINIISKHFKVEPLNGKEKAYLSYNSAEDLYKIRGSYKITNKDNLLNNFINYDFNYLSTDVYIQWISLEQLKDMQGSIKFLIKGLESKTAIPNSAFLRALKIFNLNAIFENISNEVDVGSKNLIINRAEGDLYVSQNRALMRKPMTFETSEANMVWGGEVLKDSNGLFDKLNLDLDIRLKVSENIPWYAAIFGGMPALAGGFVLENVFEDSLDNVSTFKFKVKGSVEEPLIERLN